MSLMGSKVVALLLLFNLMFFTCVSSTDCDCPHKKPPSKPIKPPTTNPPTTKPPTTKPPTTKPPTTKPPTTKPPTTKPPTTKPPTTKPPTTTPSPPAMCPRDTLKLGVCADLLGGLTGISLGTPISSSSCCSLLTGLTDLEVALCLCTALKANVLGVIKVDISVAVTLLLNACNKKVPDGFKCA